MHVSSYESLILYSVYTKLCGHYIDRIFFTIPQFLTIITSCTSVHLHYLYSALSAVQVKVVSVCIMLTITFLAILKLRSLYYRASWRAVVAHVSGRRGLTSEISPRSVAAQSWPWIMWSAGKLGRTHWENSNLETLHLIQLTCFSAICGNHWNSSDIPVKLEDHVYIFFNNT